jgi:hypothetical protein
MLSNALLCVLAQSINASPVHQNFDVFDQFDMSFFATVHGNPRLHPRSSEIMRMKLGTVMIMLGTVGVVLGMDPKGGTSLSLKRTYKWLRD